MIRVLLVEDDPVIRDTTRYFLQSQQNFEVVCAETGGDALSHARERFDVILMDVMMPVMDGLTAAREIHATNRVDAAEIPIFAMTANAFYDDVRQSKEAGMVEHLYKPIQEQELLDAIRRHVKR